MLSAFISLAALPPEGDVVSAVGFFTSFVAAGVVDSDAFDLPSAFMSPRRFRIRLALRMLGRHLL
ncbi:hypothetical protein [Bradyrhizobium elkanii]